MKRIRFLMVLFLLLLAGVGYGQSDLLFSSLDINRYAFNPAAIENNGSINFRLDGRRQWIGFPDAPQVLLLNVSNFFERKQMGISGTIYSQRTGIEQQQLIRAAYAYALTLGKGHELQFGLSAAVLFRKLDFSKLTFEQQQEGIPLSDERQVRPDFDLGIEYHHGGLIAGFAANHITTMLSKATLFKIPVQLHAYAQYFYPLNPEVALQSGFAWHQSGLVNVFDISMDAFLRNTLKVGLVYRSSTSFILRAGLKLNPDLEIHYAYDLGAGSFIRYNTGSHEIMLIWRLRKKASVLNSPRFIDN
jgi:type IX secretion system PorP/SprF family membrane protein